MDPDSRSMLQDGNGGGRLRDNETFDGGLNERLVNCSNIAGEVLKKCNVIRDRHENTGVGMLRQGEGKLMHSLGSSTRESITRKY